MMLKNPIIPNSLIQKDILQNLWQCALKHNIACAFWRLPNAKKTHFVADFSENITSQNIELENPNVKGFVISPFLNPNITNNYFIHADLHWHTDIELEEKSIFFSKIIKNSNENKHQNNKIYDFLADFDKKINTDFREKLENKHLEINTNSAFHFKNIVAKAVQEMTDQKYDKVVLSRQKWIDYPENFEVISFFEKLCERYPTAFCYVFYLPNMGIWAGATPELLLQTDQNHTFKTVALAGTQAYNPTLHINEVQWGQKEIEEQAMVSRYIINCFKKIRLREFTELGPKTTQAGNLWHLKTFFSVDMQATNFSNLASVMLPLLHPTSAVCGMPKEESMQFILENEGYPREFYTGFLGSVNIENENNLFVNLRCLQFFQQKICLYVGAGITENSLPEKEWNETEIKSNTLLDVIRN